MARHWLDANIFCFQDIIMLFGYLPEFKTPHPNMGFQIFLDRTIRSVFSIQPKNGEKK